MTFLVARMIADPGDEPVTPTSPRSGDELRMSTGPSKPKKLFSRVRAGLAFRNRAHQPFPFIQAPAKAKLAGSIETQPGRNRSQEDRKQSRVSQSNHFTRSMSGSFHGKIKWASFVNSLND
jgi:hypothetical protein